MSKTKSHLNDPTQVRLGVSPSGVAIQIPECHMHRFPNGRARVEFDDHGIYLHPCDEDEGLQIVVDTNKNLARSYGHIHCTNNHSDKAGGYFRIVACHTLHFVNVSSIYASWPPDQHRSPICIKERQKSLAQAEALELLSAYSHHMTIYELAEEMGKNQDVWLKVLSALKGYGCPPEKMSTHTEAYKTWAKRFA